MGGVAVMGSRSVRGVIPSAAPLVPSLLGVAPTFGLPLFIANKFLY